MRNTRNRKGKGNKSKIVNVRVADPASGSDGLRVDRQISAVKQSESQTRVVIGDFLDLGIPTTTATSASYNFQNVFTTDDFNSLAAQYNLFRVMSIKFDIFDTNPNVAAYNAWGVWHDNYTGSAIAFDRANIADLPDSRVISGGTGQTTLYWVAHGTAETEFQTTQTAGGQVVQQFGGLKYYIGTGGSAVQKYTVQIHAVVDFRGRR